MLKDELLSSSGLTPVKCAAISPRVLWLSHGLLGFLMSVPNVISAIGQSEPQVLRLDEKSG